MRVIDKRRRHQFMLQCSSKIEFEIVICDKLFFNIGTSWEHSIIIIIIIIIIILIIIKETYLLFEMHVPP